MEPDDVAGDQVSYSAYYGPAVPAAELVARVGHWAAARPSVEVSIGNARPFAGFTFCLTLSPLSMEDMADFKARFEPPFEVVIPILG